MQRKRPVRIELILMVISALIFGAFMLLVIYYYGNTLDQAGREEEELRNIFQSAGGPPGILVCLDEVTTVCAYQAMVDYNLVGEKGVVLLGAVAFDILSKKKAS